MLKGVTRKALLLSMLAIASFSAYARQKYNCHSDNCTPVCHGDVCGIECTDVVCTPA